MSQRATMFSVATPAMAVAACPPAPTAAMFSFSLGEIVLGFGLAAGAALLELHVSIRPEAATVDVKRNRRREWRPKLEFMSAISKPAPRAVKAIGGGRSTSVQIRPNSALDPVRSCGP